MDPIQYNPTEVVQGMNWKRAVRPAKARWLTLGIICTTLLTVIGGSMSPKTSADAHYAADLGEQTVVVDGHQPGRAFEGIGGLSASGTSRLLADYPEPERSEILDYLFKPGYGAAFQVLKVEIGGDTNSGKTAEPSHMRSRTDVNCNRGYEWWLMKEAKSRNPEIKFSALAWGVPGWFDGGVMSDDHINYLVTWLDCAASHGLTVDSIGGINEWFFGDGDPLTDHPEIYAPWFKKLKQALISNGYADVRVICCEGSWDVAGTVLDDPEFANAIDMLGKHSPHPCRSGGACETPKEARDSGEILLISEQSMGAGQGPPGNGRGAARFKAQQFNRMYIDGRVTGINVWPLVAGWYPSLEPGKREHRNGFVGAFRPWSGHYDVGLSIWASAHTTQFTEPGWRYIDEASGDLIGGGSFVTIRSVDSNDYSIVIETASATQPQQVTFEVGGGLSQEPVNVWASDFDSVNSEDWFKSIAQRNVVDGEVTLTLEPGQLYTLSTTTGQGKGQATSPPDANLQIPYSAEISEENLGASPPFFTDLTGAFEVVRCRGGDTCLRQMIHEKPNAWHFRTFAPATLVGDSNWTDYSITTGTRLRDAEWVEVIARAAPPAGPGFIRRTSPIPGYHLRLEVDGRWSLTKWDSEGSTKTLESGTINIGRPNTVKLKRNDLIRLKLSVSDNQISVNIDGRTLATVQDGEYSQGSIGLRTSRWDGAEFAQLEVTK